MGILDLFRKDEVTGAQILVCALDGSRFADLLKTDSGVYQRFYPSTTSTAFSSISQLIGAIGQKYDVVHLFANINAEGSIVDASGATINGTEFIKKCCETGVKLLWMANNTPADAYINGFSNRGQKINLVMIIDRRGPFFVPFFNNLLAKMSGGEAMPTAWNQLNPQIPNSVHPDAPDAIFSAGRAGLRLMP